MVTEKKEVNGKSIGEKIKGLKGIFWKVGKKEKKEFPEFMMAEPRYLIVMPATPDPTQIDIRYPLIEPFAYTKIKWDTARKELVYNTAEPILDKEEKAAYSKIIKGLLEIVDVELSKIKKPEEARLYVEKQVQNVITEYDLDLKPEHYLKIMYYIYRNFVGLNEIEPLMQDPYIEDIGLDGVGIPIYIVHRKFGTIRTNIVFNDLETLRDFVVKLAERCGRYISYAEPLLDGTLPSGSRIQASLAGDVTTHGPTFSIRKFTEEPFSPIDMLELNTASAEVLAFIWLAVESGLSFLICGGVATGKTTFLNTISMFIPPEAKIISIEDTRELQLPHENWIPSVARTGFGIPTEAGRYGEVTMFDLLKESFRQNPDYVIVGEVRGKEAYVMFQGMASIHAWEKVAVYNSSNFKIQPIGEVNPSISAVPSFNTKKNAFEISSITGKFEHMPREVLVKITTKTGREVIVTPDHSLFTFDDCLKPVEVGSLKIGNRIVIPASLPAGFNNKDCLDLTELLPEIRVFAPKLIKEAVKILGFYKSSEICGVKSISDYYAKFSRAKPSSMRFDKFKKLMKTADIKYDLNQIEVKFTRKSKSFPALLKITPELLRLIGYYVSEGSLDRGYKSNKISLYNKNQKILEDIRKCIFTVTCAQPKERVTKGFSEATELSFSHKVLFELLKEHCGSKSEERRIPSFVFGLSKERIGEFLSALYNGDGWFCKTKSGHYAFGYSTTSRKLANDLLYLLLELGVVASVRKRKYKGRKTTDYVVVFRKRVYQEKFLEIVKGLKRNIEFSRPGRKDSNHIGELYLDKIKSIEFIRLKKPEKVLDLSITGNQNFVGGFGGILLHNSGHSCIGTMHAGKVEDVVYRLETPPIEISPSLIETLDMIIIMVHAREKGKSARRVKEIVEIESVDPTTGVARTNRMFTWIPTTDSFERVGTSWVLQKISRLKGTSMEDLDKELKRRKKILEWLKQQKTKHYKKVAEVFSEYHKNPERVLRLAGIQ